MEKAGTQTLNKYYKVRKITGDIAIALTAFVAILILAAAFLHLPILEYTVYSNVSAGRIMVQRLGAILLLLVVWNLYLRKRSAWVITLIFLAGNLITRFVIPQRPFGYVVLAIEIFIIAVLIVHYKDFNLPADRPSIKKALLTSGVAIALVFLNATAGYFHISRGAGVHVSFGDSLAATIKMLFGAADTTGLPATAETVILWVFWICCFFIFLYILRAVFKGRQATSEEKMRARDMVKRWGQNPASYLTLEDDKTLFFGKKTEGVIAYNLISGIAIVAGDPICRPENFPALLEEFRSFCDENAYKIVFLGATDTFLDVYKEQGYAYVKCGEEARFELDAFQLAGGKMARLRAEINRAKRAELATTEYRPLEQREPSVETEIKDVWQVWLGGKKSSQLNFVTGCLGLDDPMDRRYFYARDTEGRIVAFNVFLPFAGMNGYLADMTCRKPDAPGGSTEKIMFDAFQQFREEGVRWGSMGLCPLVGIRSEDAHRGSPEKLLGFLYEKCNGFYGFKALYTAKERYNPSRWESQYIIYSTKAFSVQMCYAIINTLNPKGIDDFFKSFFQNKAEERKEKRWERRNQDASR